jgi:cyclic pyranopterin phosphate synthase
LFFHLIQISQKSLLETLQHHFSNTTLIKLEDAKNATSKNYALAQFKGSFGFISTITQPFCDTCNRIRLTADGKIKNCLFSNEETDLLTALRNGQDLEALMKSSIYNKHKKHAGIDFTDPSSIHENRTMTAIGG